MSYHTPAGWAARATVRDPALPHQVILRFGGRNMAVMVGCNCRGNVSIDRIRTTDEAWELYRDPANHREVAELEATAP